jgi:glycosyltransferase involved in cell wall biosynthesis
MSRSKSLPLGYAQLNRRRPTALVIVGDVRQGEDQKTFDELRLSIPNSKIIVTRYISHKDIPAYYAPMDVFVHSSLRDGMPNALLEAVACEKAVAATPVGGTTEVLEHRKNGILVSVNDANILAEKIQELLDNPEKRSALGKNARQLIMESLHQRKNWKRIWYFIKKSV